MTKMIASPPRHS